MADEAINAANSMAEALSGDAGSDGAADTSADAGGQASQSEQGTTHENPSPEVVAAKAFDEGMSKLLNPEGDSSDTGTTDDSGSASGEADAGTTGEAPAAKPAFDEKQTNLLKRAGLNPEVVQKLPESDRAAMLGQLDKMFKGIGHTLAEKGRAARAAATAVANQAGNGAQPPGTQNQQQQQQNQPLLKLDSSLFGEEATQALNAAVAPIFQQLQAVTQALNESRQSQAVQERDALRRNVDDLFSTMAENHAAYGKGSVKSLKTEQVEARKATLKLADDIWYGARSEGQEMSVVDAIQMAHNALTADQQVKNAKQNIAKQIGQRRNSFSARPSQRQTIDQKMSADERATKAWNEGAKAIGLS